MTPVMIRLALTDGDEKEATIPAGYATGGEAWVSPSLGVRSPFSAARDAGTRHDFTPEPLPPPQGEGVQIHALIESARRASDIADDGIHARFVAALNATAPTTTAVATFDCGRDTPFCPYPSRNCKRAHGGRSL